MDDAQAPLVETPGPPRRLDLIIEVAVVLALLFLPLFITSVRDYFGLYRPSQTIQEDVYRVITGVAYSCLPIYLIWSGNERLKKFGFVKFDSLDAVWAVMLASASFAVILAYQPLKSFFAGAGNAVLEQPFHPNSPLWFAPIVILATAFFEEVLWRSYMFIRLKQLGCSTTSSVLICAAAYASIQLYQGWLWLPGAFVIGLIFGCFFAKNRSLWPVVLGHAACNFAFFLVNPIWTTHKPLH